MSSKYTKYYVIEGNPISSGLFNTTTPTYVKGVVWERMDARIAPQENFVVEFIFTTNIREAQMFETIKDACRYLGEAFLNWDFLTQRGENIPQVHIRRVLWDNRVVDIDPRLQRNK